MAQPSGAVAELSKPAARIQPKKQTEQQTKKQTQQQTKQQTKQRSEQQTEQQAKQQTKQTKKQTEKPQSKEPHALVLTAAVFPKDLLNIYNFRLQVPEFQRTYAWKTSHVEQLMIDLEALVDAKPQFYHLGSLVLLQHVATPINQPDLPEDYVEEIKRREWWKRQEKEAQRQCQVIDGQQRPTTLTILYACIHTFLLKVQQEYGVTSEKLKAMADGIRRCFVDSNNVGETS
jgi:uncharacterized protein with ParB-like and HNH nuclease domain